MICGDSREFFKRDTEEGLGGSVGQPCRLQYHRGIIGSQRSQMAVVLGVIVKRILLWKRKQRKYK